MVNPNVEQYKIAGALDVPDIDVHAHLRLGRRQQHAFGRHRRAVDRADGRRPSPTRSRMRSGRGSSRFPSRPKSVLEAVDRDGSDRERRPGMKPSPSFARRPSEEAARVTATPRQLAQSRRRGPPRPDEGRSRQPQDGRLDRRTSPATTRSRLGPPAKIGALATLARIADDPGLRRAYPALAARGRRAPRLRRSATWRRSEATSARGPAAGTTGSRSSTAARRADSDCFARDGENRFHAIFDTDLLCCCIHPSATRERRSLAYGAKLDIGRPEGASALCRSTTSFIAPCDDATRENALEPGEIVDAATLPRAARRHPVGLSEVQGEGVLRLAAGRDLRGPRDRRRHDAQARVVLGSVAPTPCRSKAAEAVLVGGKPGDELARRAAEAAVRERKPLSQKAYKVRLARVELERALREARA